jgi:hypothetical protein
LNELEPGKKYRAAVTLKDQDGFHSKFSEIVALEPLASPEDHQDSSNTSLPYLGGGGTVGVVVVIVVLVVVVLSTAVGVFAFKNLKLRRSFLAMANSHYNTRSGAATISTSDGLDEDDTPIIRGFSDDEPLVIS